MVVFGNIMGFYSQEQAVEVGAIYGIGKDQYRDPQTAARLKPYLG